MLKKTFYNTCFLLLTVLFISCNRQKSVTICFTGDVLLDRGVREQINSKGIDWLFKDVSAIFMSADATVINMECPVTNRISPINKHFIFRADPIWLPVLAQNGITHAVLANNHTIDQGRTGLKETAFNLEKAGITCVGYGENYQKACSPVWFRQKGIEIALFSSVLLPLENWVVLEELPAISQLTIDELCKEIALCREQKPNSRIIANLHWGNEYHRTPTLQQRIQARKLIDAGANAIIGHHPHVVQQEEIYNGKPIFYSLGNFIFDQSKPETCKSRIVKFTFTPDTTTWQIHPVTIRQCKPSLDLIFNP